MSKGKMIRPMNELNIFLAEALSLIIKPIVKQAVLEALTPNCAGFNQRVSPATSFLTIKQAAETSGLGASTIRLLIRRRKLRAQKVGRRVLVKRTDLETFLESHPIEAIRE
jgi:excisionase family DNA binding protein